MREGDLHRDLGRLEGQVEALKIEMTDIKAELVAVRADLKVIRSRFDQAKGGWKLLVVVAGLAGSAGAFVTKIWPGAQP